jgi:hypothetical protein
MAVPWYPGSLGQSACRRSGKRGLSLVSYGSAPPTSSELAMARFRRQPLRFANIFNFPKCRPCPSTGSGQAGLRPGRDLVTLLFALLCIAPRRILGLKAKAFTRLRRASHFLLRGQEKVTKEKATPMQRSPGILPCDFAQRLRGWLTVHPWTGSQLARIPASHPTGLFSAAAPLHRGPIHCASCAAKTRQFPAILQIALRFCS